jgi:hypothetical protein
VCQRKEHTTMYVRHWTRALFVTAACAIVASPTAVDSAQLRPRGGVVVDRGPFGISNREAYERGFREGLRRGEDDGRRGRTFDYARDSVYRSADRGYDRRYGTRETYRAGFRQGFSEGYRSGYDRVRVVAVDRGRDNRGLGRGRAGGRQEPAYARGFADGYEQGIEDGEDRDRYDPVRHGDYREADQGYFDEYGSKDAYRNNYRVGFREGYDGGYRDGTLRRR